MNSKQTIAAAVRTCSVVVIMIFSGGIEVGLHAQQVAGAPGGTTPSLAERPKSRTAFHALPGTERLQSGRSHRLAGAAIGFVAGAGITYVVLHSGGSTSLCDRSENQDAIRPIECAGLVVLGGAVGAGIGFVIGGLFGTERADAAPLERIRVGVTPDIRDIGGVGLSVAWQLR